MCYPSDRFSSGNLHPLKTPAQATAHGRLLSRPAHGARATPKAGSSQSLRCALRPEPADTERFGTFKQPFQHGLGGALAPHTNKANQLSSTPYATPSRTEKDMQTPNLCSWGQGFQRPVSPECVPPLLVRADRAAFAEPKGGKSPLENRSAAYTPLYSHSSLAHGPMGNL